MADFDITRSVGPSGEFSSSGNDQADHAYDEINSFIRDLRNSYRDTRKEQDFDFFFEEEEESIRIALEILSKQANLRALMVRREYDRAH